MKSLNNNLFKAGICLSLLLSISSSVFAKAPQVLASIKPIQLISQAITEGVTDTDVLLPPGASPHNYHMRPSDARKLRSSQVIFWVGPTMESFLERSLAGSEKSISVAMMDISGIRLRKNGQEEAGLETHKHEQAHEHYHDDQHDAQHDHGEYDPHIWLSSDNARVMATKMSQVLSEIDQEHATHYQKNLALFLSGLDETDRRNELKIKSLKHQPLFVFHDAYGYLQEQYHLNIAGHFTLNPEQPPGAKHLTHLRHQLKAVGKTCIFREPQFQPAYIHRITQGLPISVSVLDPLGGDITVQAKGYFLLLNTLVDGIQQCLTPALQSVSTQDASERPS